MGFLPTFFTRRPTRWNCPCAVLEVGQEELQRQIDLLVRGATGGVMFAALVVRETVVLTDGVRRYVWRVAVRAAQLTRHSVRRMLSTP